MIRKPVLILEFLDSLVFISQGSGSMYSHSTVCPFFTLGSVLPCEDLCIHTCKHPAYIAKLCPHSLQVPVPCPLLGYRGIYISSEFRFQKDRHKNKLYPGHGRGSSVIRESHFLAWVSGAWSGYGFPDAHISPWSSKLPSHRKRHGTGGPEQALSNSGPEKGPRAGHNTLEF